MKIAYVHPDAEGREEDAAKGLYPRNQLWGADWLRACGHDVQTVPTKDSGGLAARLGHFLNKLTRNRLGDFHIELQALSKLRWADVLYAPSGHLFLLPLLRRLGFLKAKLVTWFFRLPDSARWWRPRNLRFSSYVLNGFDGILCLTRQAADAFKERTDGVHVQYLPWFADPDIFQPKPEETGQGYFLCVGKTRRDYPTLLKACAQVSDAQFRIIAPGEAAQGTTIPDNVQFIETSDDPPDTAISYPELRDWYAGARAILIPLTGDSRDTSGYTTLLEAITMGKPVVMTRSGCLDIDVEDLGIGRYVPPADSAAWVHALGSLGETSKMCQRARQLAEQTFSAEQFGKSLDTFLQQA